MWVLVRRCGEEDVAVLAEVQPPGSLLAETFFARQQAGELTYLVGWVGDCPAGTGVLTSAASLGSTRRAELKNLHVREGFRGAGVGTAIVLAAEEHAAAGGIEVVAIGVALDNPRARALYERLGYLGTGVVTETTYTYIDSDGAEHSATEQDEEFVKGI